VDRFSYSVLWDHTHWRERAEQARAMAERMEDPESVRIILGIAESYDRLADRAERAENRTLPNPGLLSTVCIAA
jgi:hypothetical protein